MKLTCENCHGEFYFEPSGDAVPFAKCPHCDFPNPVPVEHDSLFGEAEVAYAQCFNCGRKMAYNPDQAIPICPDCLQGEERVEQSKDWMVRKSGGQIYGPFDLETLQAWIAAYKIEPDDEVSKVGGQWKPFHSHPQFSRLFERTGMKASAVTGPIGPTPQVEEKKQKSKARKAKRKKKVKKRALTPKELAGIAVKILLTVVIAAASYQATVKRWLLIPEPWVNEAVAQYREHVASHFETTQRVRNPLTQRMVALVRTLRDRYPDVHEPSQTLFVRGRSLFLLDTPRSLVASRKLLEQAVVANPMDDLALSALAVWYAEKGDLKLQQDAITLIDQAQQLNPSSAAVKRASAAFDIATKQYEKARSEAQAALKINPADAEAEYYIGLSYWQPGTQSPDSVVEHLEKAVKQDPLLHKAYHQLGKVYFAQHDYRKSYRAYQKKLSIEPKNAQALADLGRLYERIGDYDRALNAYERAHRLAGDSDPVITLDYAVLLYQNRGVLRRARTLLMSILPKGDDTNLSLADQKRAIVHAGTVLRLNGETSRAIAVLDRALAIDPGYGPALFQEGLAYYSLRRYDDAGKAFRAASAAGGPRTAQSAVREHLGLVLSAQKKARAAVDEFKGAIDLDPTNQVARLLLINQYLNIGQVSEALAEAKNASTVDPYYGDRRAIRTLYYYRPPQLAATLPQFRRLAQKRFYDADAVASLGMLMLELRNYKGATRAFKQALSADEESSVALFNLGALAYHQGEARNAIQYLTRALGYQSQMGIAHVYLGLAYTGAGRYDDADRTFQNALRYQRTNATLHDGIGVLRARSGSTEQAREAFLEAIELDSDYVPAHKHIFQYCE